MSTSQSRHVYTREQRAILEASFARQSHPDINEKERLAKLFNCNLIQISNWFQNHRRRMKKQQKSASINPPSIQYCQPDYCYCCAPSQYMYYSHDPYFVYYNQ